MVIGKEEGSVGMTLGHVLVMLTIVSWQNNPIWLVCPQLHGVTTSTPASKGSQVAAQPLGEVNAENGEALGSKPDSQTLPGAAVVPYGAVQRRRKIVQNKATSQAC